MCNHEWEILLGSQWKWCNKCGCTRSPQQNISTGKVTYGPERYPIPHTIKINKPLELGLSPRGVGSVETNQQLPVLTLKEVDMYYSLGKIHAIKSVRDRTGLDLKSCKEAVEQCMIWIEKP